MKEIITVDVSARKIDFEKATTDLLCVGLFAKGKKLDKSFEPIDKKLGGEISKVVKLGDFTGAAKTSVVIYGDKAGKAKRLLLIGLGEKKDVSIETLRTAAAICTSKAVELKAAQTVLSLHELAGDKLDAADVGQALAEGAFFGSYRYDEYVSKTDSARRSKLDVMIAQSKSIAKLAKGVEAGCVVGRAQSFARTIANRPGNVINPPSLAVVANRMAKETPGLSCTVFDKKQLTQKKMGGILAVGSGSKSDPRLIVLKYTGATGKGSRGRTIALVGKAITFDSGGISIKPSSGMEEMKFDKSGGIAVLGAMKAIAQLRPAVNVYGIIPSAENMPGGSSYRPGDIVTTFSGKTVEVQNTDAEGRMILCDALNYASKQKCDTIIDIATLTGACMVALGKYKAGLMGNDDKLIKALQVASASSGEPVWHMPSGDEYAEEMKSKIADLKNIGSRWGGACTAAAFLSQFVEDKKWAHIDMAGVDMFDSGQKIGSVGSTGFGVRLLTSYVLSQSKK